MMSHHLQQETARGDKHRVGLPEQQAAQELSKKNLQAGDTNRDQSSSMMLHPPPQDQKYRGSMRSFGQRVGMSCDETNSTSCGSISSVASSPRSSASPPATATPTMLTTTSSSVPAPNDGIRAMILSILKNTPVSSTAPQVSLQDEEAPMDPSRLAAILAWFQKHEQEQKQQHEQTMVLLTQALLAAKQQQQSQQASSNEEHQKLLLGRILQEAAARKSRQQHQEVATTQGSSRLLPQSPHGDTRRMSTNQCIAAYGGTT
mmetsp:Transcript_9055/g.18799  ORF Transcript_9055/g.18799 Transcript_9055/m.18799 type:complete len:260 (-) Transcript_9055:6-785(-)